MNNSFPPATVGMMDPCERFRNPKCNGCHMSAFAGILKASFSTPEALRLAGAEGDADGLDDALGAAAEKQMHGCGASVASSVATAILPATPL